MSYSTKLGKIMTMAANKTFFGPMGYPTYRLHILLCLIMFPLMVFGGTLFEDEKTTDTPFISESGGVDSLFVNPASSAGMSGFELSGTAGFRSTASNISQIFGVGGVLASISESREVNSFFNVRNLSEYYTNGMISKDVLEALYGGSALDPGNVDWKDPVALRDVVETLTSTDQYIIATNYLGVVNKAPNGTTNTDFYDALSGNIDTQVLASAKMGFLLKGFGLGLYTTASTVVLFNSDAQTFGYENTYGEAGLVAGGGFHLFDKKLALGFNGTYGLLMKKNNIIGIENLSEIYSGNYNYGHFWKVDVGMLWQVSPSFRIGLVFNDVAGDTEFDTPYVAEGIKAILTHGLLMKEFQYKFNLDLDVGMAFQPVDQKNIALYLDLYDVVGYGRDIAKNKYDAKQALYAFLEHFRIGAKFKVLKFMDLGLQYYDHYLSAGVGFDVRGIGIYGEVKIHDQGFSAKPSPQDILFGADLTIRIHI